VFFEGIDSRIQRWKFAQQRLNNKSRRGEKQKQNKTENKQKQKIALAGRSFFVSLENEWERSC
jgi:tRNA G37 N-methylase TrmD